MGLVPNLKLVTVATAGTAVPVLGSSDKQSDIVQVQIQAQTGTIYVGDSTVSSSQGIKLTAAGGAILTLLSDARNTVDLAKVYVDGGANGDKASVLYFVRV